MSNDVLQKVLTLVLPTATVTEVFVSTMNKFLSNSYDALEETITHTKSLKFKIYPGENVTYFRAVILVYDECLKSARVFDPKNLGYTNRIFEDNSDSIFRL